MLKGKRATSDNAAATKGNGCKKLVTLKMWLITLLMKASPLGSKKKKKKKSTYIDAKHRLFVFRKHFPSLAYSWNSLGDTFVPCCFLWCESRLAMYQLCVLPIK